MRIDFVVIAVLAAFVALMAACGGDSSEPFKIPSVQTITVQQAIEMNYRREDKPCTHVTSFPDFYAGVPFEELGDGLCAFYFAPR